MKRILLLQGPMGPFFNRIRKMLQIEGHQVYKVNFNGGDTFFYKGKKEETFEFLYNIDAWPAYLKRLIDYKKIDLIIAYGDCRVYHSVARKVASTFKIPVYFFEEGYLRPNFITIEEGGVNANSKLIRLSRLPNKTPDEQQWLQRTSSDFHYRIIYAVMYYGFCLISKKKYPCYQHHRSLSSLYESICWIRSLVKKYIFLPKDKMQQWLLQKRYKNRYYLVPLQIKDDAQIKYHSDFKSIDEFIEATMVSFAKYSPHGTVLVIKHHPMDRGHSDYAKKIKQLAIQLKIVNRVVYLRTGHNPTLLRNCKSLVTINSTMGLSALIHNKPVIAMGRAVYAKRKLTYQGKLKHFWHIKRGPSKRSVQILHKYLLTENQVRQSFYRNLSPMSNCLRFITPLANANMKHKNDLSDWHYRNETKNHGPEETSYAG